MDQYFKSYEELDVRDRLYINIYMIIYINLILGASFNA